jgi:CheY-like chemotaxis protein
VPNSKRVLIVEDDVRQSAALASILRVGGWHVTEA